MFHIPHLRSALAGAALAGSLCAVPSAHAQADTPAATRNVVQLSGSATVEVAQDLLTIVLSTVKEGSDASAVQGQLQKALEAALAEVRGSAQPGAMEVRTGNFSLVPRYSREGKSNGWQGTAELVLEGRDFARISVSATRVQTLTVANVFFAVSAEARSKAQEQAQGMAIARFRSRALDIAKGFGFGAYVLREVAVSGDEQGGGMPRPQLATMARSAMVADAPLPVEAGKAAVQVTVRGAVQLQ